MRISRLRRIVEDTDTRAGRLFDWTVQFLILVSLVSFALETLPDLSPKLRRDLYAVEVGTIACFTAEYILRLVVAERPLRYALSFFGLVDLLAILPFYLALGLDLRFVRLVRMLRVVRLLKMARYNRALRRLNRALVLAREELVLYMVITAMLLFVSAVGIYYCEHDAQPQAFASVPHALWWAVCTLTTVGYGDVYPVTPLGKFFTFVVLMVGLAAVAAPAGIFAEALSRARMLDEDEPDSTGSGE